MSARGKSLTTVRDLKDALVNAHQKKILRRVISGGQTGVDIAALKAADDLNIATAGAAPKGWMTEIGPRKGLLKSYKLHECQEEGYPARTIKNVMDSDMTLLMGYMTGGTKLTAELCFRLQRQRHFIPFEELRREAAVDLAFNRIVSCRRGFGRAIVLNVAGNRASRVPEIEDLSFGFLSSLFTKILNAEA